MEEYLRQVHAEDYLGLDDEMPDAFDNWMQQLDVNEWIELADKYAVSDYAPVKKDGFPF